MTPKALTRRVHTQIPLSKAMGITIPAASVRYGVTFKLPLAPNKNHKNTAFGGTLVAAQALASWAWLVMLLEYNKISAEVVVQRQSAEFLRPVAFDFKVMTKKPDVGKVKKFLNTLTKHDRARLTIRAEVLCRGKIAATYSGEYVAIKT